MKRNDAPKLCNMTYTNDEDGSQVHCNMQGPPRRAAYQKVNARVCRECFPAVVEKLASPYPAGAARTIAIQQIRKMFRPI